MNLHIAICDDYEIDRHYLRQLTVRWSQMQSQPVQIEEYISADAFLFHYEDRKLCDILLLDIEMPGMDGLSLAKKLRQSHADIQIVFITGFPDYMSQGYEVDAVHYLLKPIQEASFFETLQRAHARIAKKESDYILLSLDGIPTKTDKSEIYYIEASAHTSVLHTQRGSYSLSMSISQMEHMLAPGMISCHRSFLVTVAHIQKLTKTSIFLDNQCEIPLSRNCYHNVYQAFIHYNTSAQF